MTVLKLQNDLSTKMQVIAQKPLYLQTEDNIL